MTVILRVHAERPETALIERAAACVGSGGLVAYPTETFYGLAVDPRDGAAVDRLFAAKGRPAELAMPLIAASAEQAAEVGELTPLARRLAGRFWPGALTLVLPALPGLAEAVHGGRSTIAVRVSPHPVAMALARAVGHPITSTSANPTGESPALTADAVARGLGAMLDVVLDAGAAAGGPPSTIVDVTSGTPVLLRAGVIAWSRVLESLR